MRYAVYGIISNLIIGQCNSRVSIVVIIVTTIIIIIIVTTIIIPTTIINIIITIIVIVIIIITIISIVIIDRFLNKINPTVLESTVVNRVPVRF